MPVYIKAYDCIGCSTTNPNNFYEGNKSWCKKCYGKRIKGAALKSFKCKVCGTKDKENFYTYLKSKCKICNRVSS